MSDGVESGGRPSNLKGRDRRQLRSRGRALPAAFVVGKGGLTIGGHRKVAELLKANPLVKVRVLPASPLSASEASEELAIEAGAEVVQVLGNTILLYREPAEEESKPKAGVATPPRGKRKSSTSR